MPWKVLHVAAVLLTVLGCVWRRRQHRARPETPAFRVRRISRRNSVPIDLNTLQRSILSRQERRRLIKRRRPGFCQGLDALQLTFVPRERISRHVIRYQQNMLGPLWPSCSPKISGTVTTTVIRIPIVVHVMTFATQWQHTLIAL